METFLKPPPELVFAVQWSFGVLLTLTLLTKTLVLLRNSVWQDVLALGRRLLVTAGRSMADAVTCPIGHPRVAFVLTTYFSAICYCLALLLSTVVVTAAIEVSIRDTLPPWRHVEILLMIAALIIVAMFAFAEAERARLRAHELRHQWQWGTHSATELDSPK